MNLWSPSDETWDVGLQNKPMGFLPFLWSKEFLGCGGLGQ
jgi:hypothetical protein